MIPIFEKASKKVETSSIPNPKNEQREHDKDNDNNENNICIHLPHHPNNPTTDELRTSKETPTLPPKNKFTHRVTPCATKN
jgi:hypothetical protein